MVQVRRASNGIAARDSKKRARAHQQHMRSHHYGSEVDFSRTERLEHKRNGSKSPSRKRVRLVIKIYQLSVDTYEVWKGSAQREEDFPLLKGWGSQKKNT